MCEHDGHLRTRGKCRTHVENTSRRRVFSSLLECSQMSGVFYHSVINGLIGSGQTLNVWRPNTIKHCLVTKHANVEVSGQTVKTCLIKHRWNNWYQPLSKRGTHAHFKHVWYAAVPVSFPELRSPWPAVGKRELWEHPFRACAIVTTDADCALRSKTGYAEFGYLSRGTKLWKRDCSCPKEQNSAHQTQGQKKCFKFLIACLMAFKFYQTRPNTIRQHQTRCPNVKMFGQQTMFDGVWSPNISRLSRLVGFFICFMI